MSSMKFIKHIFHGEWISVLIGHPEFEVLFAVEHIARLGFVKNPSSARSLVMEESEGYGFIQLNEMAGPILGSVICDPSEMRGNEGGVWLSSAAEAYRVLLRAGSPSASTFRRLVTLSILPDVREMSQAQKQCGSDDVDGSVSAHQELTIKILERELAAERRHAEQLIKSLKADREYLKAAFEEISLLRKGVPYVERCPVPEGLLERMQSEQDQHALAWRRELMETEVSLCKVDREEQWWRSQRAREGREAFARMLRKK